MAEEKKFVQDIADFNTNFAQWFTDVVIKNELCDYGPVKGTMVIRPYGYAIWENIQHDLDKKFKEAGVQNAYFPMLIPESYLKKEASHVEGFAPEVAVVTHAGGAKLEEPLVIRPTSETIICEMYSKWVKSYRDLPLILNQWCNVVRWEKTTRPFLRTSEFLWQEGHTVHATQKEADECTRKFLNIYVDMAKETLAIPMFNGKKTDREKFPGAVETFTIEAMMHDGKSLQSGTSHNLGQNFAKASDIKFLNKEGKLEYAYSTSWGISTRLIGALIMVHGDERGISLPPRVAPYQTVIVPIASHKPGVMEKADEIFNRLKNIGIRVKLEDSDNTTGWKFNQWEMKGVPIRIEFGPRDLENGNVIIFRRDTYEKITVKLSELENEVLKLIDIIQVDMYNKAKAYSESRIVNVSSLNELISAMDDKKFARVSCCCNDAACEVEAIIKEKTSATARFIESENSKGKCICCGKSVNTSIIFARAY